MSRRIAAAAFALMTLLAACADEGDTSSTGTTDGSTAGATDPSGSTPASTGDDPSSTGSDYPPNDVAAMKGIFDPFVEPLGLRITRAALVDRSDGYEFSDTGSHLALYVEPIDESSYELDDYVDNIYGLMAAVTPEVFDQYAGIQSYDICQEPYQDEDDRYEPFPVTQVEVSRDSVADYDWESGDLASFLAFLDAHDDTTLLVDDDVESADSYEAARADAGLD